MIQVRCKALLFDLDGVLIDSTPAVSRVWKAWALEHGFDADEVIHRAHGRPSISTIREYLPNADHSAENNEVERREIEDLDGIVPLPGALALLQSLPLERWAIVTSCTRALAEVRVRAGGLPVPRHFLTSSEVVNGKPHPEPYIKGATMLGLGPEECVVFEDVPAGIRSGKGSGARVIALRTTVADADLRAAGAHWVLESCAAVKAEATSDGLLLALDVR